MSDILYANGSNRDFRAYATNLLLGRYTDVCPNSNMSPLLADESKPAIDTTTRFVAQFGIPLTSSGNEDMTLIYQDAQHDMRAGIIQRRYRHPDAAPIPIPHRLGTVMMGSEASQDFRLQAHVRVASEAELLTEMSQDLALSLEIPELEPVRILQGALELTHAESQQLAMSATYDVTQSGYICIFANTASETYIHADDTLPLSVRGLWNQMRLDQIAPHPEDTDLDRAVSPQPTVSFPWAQQGGPRQLTALTKLLRDMSQGQNVLDDVK